MKTSEYLEQTLSFEQSPAIEQYFEFRASHIFELQGGVSSIAIHVQRPQSDQSIDSWTLVQEGDRKQEFVSDWEPPSPVDWHRYSRENPPHYDGSPGLELQRISNAEDLKKIAIVRKFTVVMGVQTDVFLHESCPRNAFVCGVYIGSLSNTFKATHCSSLITASSSSGTHTVACK